MTAPGSHLDTAEQLLDDLSGYNENGPAELARTAVSLQIVQVYSSLALVRAVEAVAYELRKARES